MVERLKNQGIKVYVIHTEKPFDFTVWKKVKNLIEKEQIDIVHAHGTRANSNMFWAARKAGVPLIYTCHAWSFHLDQNPLKKKLRVLSEDFLTSKAKVNICGSKANRDTGRQLFRSFDAVVINNSIDSKKFDPYGQYKDVRKELNIGKDEIIITSVARFTLQKQPLKLIAAFAEVCKQVSNVRLLMVGDGEEKEKARQLVQKLNIGERVIFQPFRQDVPDVLAACDIFVLPSLWEAFPIALLEAMSMGKAVIGTNVDGTPEIIEHNVNGILIGIENLEKDLVEPMVLLCKDHDLRSRFQQNAIKSIYNTYNVETLARKNEEVYQQLVLR
jgi:glycosyltransferase involved in cell wall biosynthesis